MRAGRCGKVEHSHRAALAEFQRVDHGDQHLAGQWLRQRRHGLLNSLPWDGEHSHVASSRSGTVLHRHEVAVGVCLAQTLGGLVGALLAA